MPGVLAKRAEPKIPEIVKAPLQVPVEESRAQRLQRQQARFRDRGGIFVPSNRNTLADILLGRKTAGHSPQKARQRSASVSPRKGKQSNKKTADAKLSAHSASTKRTSPRKTRKSLKLGHVADDDEETVTVKPAAAKRGSSKKTAPKKIKQPKETEKMSRDRARAVKGRPRLTSVVDDDDVVQDSAPEPKAVPSNTQTHPVRHSARSFGSSKSDTAGHNDANDSATRGGDRKPAKSKKTNPAPEAKSVGRRRKGLGDTEQETEAEHEAGSSLQLAGNVSSKAKSVRTQDPLSKSKTNLNRRAGSSQDATHQLGKADEPTGLLSSVQDEGEDMMRSSPRPAGSPPKKRSNHSDNDIGENVGKTQKSKRRKVVDLGPETELASQSETTRHSKKAGQTTKTVAHPSEGSGDSTTPLEDNGVAASKKRAREHMDENGSAKTDKPKKRKRVAKSDTEREDQPVEDGNSMKTAKVRSKKRKENAVATVASKPPSKRVKSRKAPSKGSVYKSKGPPKHVLEQIKKPLPQIEDDEPDPINFLS